jgi:outer membrane protein assembly factor BamD
MAGKFKSSALMVACGILVLAASGCSLYDSVRNYFVKQDDVEPVEVLIQKGMDEYDSGDYKTSLTYFQRVKDWYPFSKYVILAELKIADAHYNLQQYEEAIFAYQEFIDLHPNNEAVPYVAYQIGRCYFDQVDTIDRDQSSARKALENFRQLRQQYPDSLYAEKATEHINKCLKNIAGNEFYIGMFYYKNKNYAAALRRFKSVVTDYPDVGVHRVALKYIAECESSLAKQAKDD